jgi:hypothetical protein
MRVVAVAGAVSIWGQIRELALAWRLIFAMDEGGEIDASGFAR